MNDGGGGDHADDAGMVQMVMILVGRLKQSSAAELKPLQPQLTQSLLPSTQKSLLLAGTNNLLYVELQDA